MSELLKSIDARTKLAGTNKLEILLFSLGTNSRTGRRETFGINVQVANAKDSALADNGITLTAAGK